MSQFETQGKQVTDDPFLRELDAEKDGHVPTRTAAYTSIATLSSNRGCNPAIAGVTAVRAKFMRLGLCDLDVRSLHAFGPLGRFEGHFLTFLK